LWNSWITGFTDAEGCFSVSIYKNRKNINIVKTRFLLDQKNGSDQLNIIANLFSPITVKLKGYPVKLRTKTTNVYRLDISCTDINNPNYKIIRDYYNKYPLKTTKHSSFLLWSQILDLFLGKQPLNKESINEIKLLARKINKYTIENNPLGFSKFS
jgi:hypothetical protein